MNVLVAVLMQPNDCVMGGTHLLPHTAASASNFETTLVETTKE